MESITFTAATSYIITQNIKNMPIQTTTGNNAIIAELISDEIAIKTAGDVLDLMANCAKIFYIIPQAIVK